MTITKQNIKVRRAVLSKDALKYLARMPRDSAKKVVRAIKDIGDGVGNHVKTRKLSGRNLWRLKVVGLRVIYQMKDEANVLFVVKIGPRGDVYK